MVRCPLIYIYGKLYTTNIVLYLQHLQNIIAPINITKSQLSWSNISLVVWIPKWYKIVIFDGGSFMAVLDIKSEAVWWWYSAAEQIAQRNRDCLEWQACPCFHSGLRSLQGQQVHWGGSIKRDLPLALSPLPPLAVFMQMVALCSVTHTTS